MNQMAFNTTMKWYLWIADAATAFLQGHQDTSERAGKLFLRAPRDAIIEMANVFKAAFYEITGNLYGLSNAPVTWAREVVARLTKLGFIVHSFDHMMFYFPDPLNKPYPCAVLICHVDDFLMTYNDNFPFEKLLSAFKWGNHQHAEVGKEFTYKGKEFALVQENGQYLLKVTQKAFIESMQKGKLPRGIDKSQKLSNADWPEFRSITGCMQWLSSQTRLDVASTVSLMNHGSETTYEHLGTLYKSLEVLKRTADLGLVIHPVPLNASTVIVAYSDSSWANAQGSASQHGQVILLAAPNVTETKSVGALIDWKSGRSKRVCRSTLAAEAVSADSAKDRLAYASYALGELMFGIPAHKVGHRLKTLLVTDCKSLYDCVAAENPNIQDKRSLVNIRSIQELINSRTIHWVPTFLQKADCLTKVSEDLMKDLLAWLQKPMIQLREDVTSQKKISRVSGSGSPVTKLVVPYNGQQDQWSSYGTMEPDCATAIKNGAKKLGEMKGRTFLVLGAGSELGPVRPLLEAGATVAAVATRRPKRWAELIAFARQSAGTLLVPVSPQNGEVKNDEDLAAVAGADLLTETPQVLEWLLRCGREATGKVTMGTYLYADGEANVRLTVASDFIVEAVKSLGKDKVSFAYLSSCSTSTAIPAEAIQAQEANFNTAGRWATMFGERQSCKKLDDGTFFLSGFKVLQGPNYALAQMMRQWRVALLHMEGFTVSAPMAPICRTESVVHNATMAVLLEGIAHFPPQESYDAETGRMAMLAILISDLTETGFCSEATRLLVEGLSLLPGGKYTIFQRGSSQRGSVTLIKGEMLTACAATLCSIRVWPLLQEPARSFGPCAMRSWLILCCLLPVEAGDFDSWSLVLLEDALKDKGAACLDGSPPGYFIEKGWGSGERKWIVHFLGGGWCLSLEDCLARSKTPLGSTKNYSQDPNETQKQKILEMGDGGVHGYLSNRSEVNPDFYNWNKVFALYCDGSSRNSEVEGAVAVGNESIYFRGHGILEATIASIKERMGQQSATDFIVGGCSAGGLTVYLHLDYIRRLMPQHVRVVGLPQCGMFMDQPDYTGKPSYSPLYANIFNLMGMAKSPSLHQGCVEKYPQEPWKCFMAQYVMPFIQTPFFAVNSFYDSWQFQEMLHLPGDCAFQQKCNRDERASQHNLRDIMVMNFTSSAKNQSYFLYSCVSHCQYMNLDYGWLTLSVSGGTLQSAIRHWYFQKLTFHGVSILDEPNENPSCYKVSTQLKGGAVRGAEVMVMV
eukprot:s670_g27.t1